MSAAEVFEPAGVEYLDEWRARQVPLSDADEAVLAAESAQQCLLELSALDDLGDDRLIELSARLVTQAEAFAADVAAAIEARGHSAIDGFTSTKNLIAHRAKLSGPSALDRTKRMRMFARLDQWANTARSGQVGNDQVREMALVAANPRAVDALVEYEDALLHDAQTLSFDAFRRRLRDLERLADTSGRDRAEQANDRRAARIVRTSDGGWRLTARFGALDGAEVNEIFAHMVDAEYRTDAAAARDDAEFDELERTQPQRAADAVLNIFRRAASNPGLGRAPLPTLNVLIDEQTLGAVVLGEAIPTGRYDDIVCRTQSGESIDLHEAAGMTLWAHIRRVVHDSRGTVIDLGRRQRLFSGSSRDAALLLSMSCNWPGCTQPVRRCHVDHAVEWQHTGTTAPGNANCCCEQHNLHKQRRGIQAHRDATGAWVFTHPDGRIIE